MASPSISTPRCIHEVPFHTYTRTWPLLLPFTPSFKYAPIATIDPSADMLRPCKYVLSSPVPSPSIS